MTGKAPMLFGDLFFALREAGLPTTFQEWLTLMEALGKGSVAPDLRDFYHVGRSLLVKSEAHFDLWDQVFAAVFADGEMPVSLAEELLAWLEDPIAPAGLTAAQISEMERLPLDELRELFEERLKEQDERHDGGNRWVGTGGTSPFGHSGDNPAGVRVGGQGRRRSAVQIATERRFRDYRSDRVIDTRAFAVALKKLRRLSRHEGRPELDVEASVDETCRNAGELELVFRPPRENQARVLLLMDVGGSMTPYARLVETLFSAASGLNHWRKFEAYEFHNCVYDHLYKQMWRGEEVATNDILAERPKDTFLILVGDASMAPSELTQRWGAIDYYERNESPGLVWLHRLRSRFERAVWVNPMPEGWWNGWTTRAIARLFPMVPLTVQGLDDAVDILLRRRPEPVPMIEEVLGR